MKLSEIGDDRPQRLDLGLEFVDAGMHGLTALISELAHPSHRDLLMSFQTTQTTVGTIVQHRAKPTQPYQ
jgi:hypothetical protein